MAKHSSYQHQSSGNWKLIVLIIVLIVVVAAVAFLLVRLLWDNGSSSQAMVGLTTTVSIQDANQKDVTSKVSVTESSRTPDTASEGDEFTGLNITWTGRGSLSAPAIVTVTDTNFPNGDGLAVYQYDPSGDWELLGTYLIASHSVSFQTNTLSYFAFQVISANPTPTPVPTEEPEEEVEEEVEPTPVPDMELDYGDYDTVLEGQAVETNAISLGNSYIIAIVDDSSSSDVTYFDSEDGSESAVTTASLLVNYDGSSLHTVDVQLAQLADGTYYLTDDIVEGMLFTAVFAEEVSGYDRYSLENNGKYLNVDDASGDLVLDSNSDRTRWLYGLIALDDDETFTTLSYYLDAEQYYPDDTQTTSTTSDSEYVIPTDELSVSLDTDESKAMTVIIFQFVGETGYSLSSTGTLTLSVDIGDLSLADVIGSVTVYMDDEEVDAENYTLVSTSSGFQVVLSANYVATLDYSVVHNARITYMDPNTNGTVETTFDNISLAALAPVSDSEDDEEEEESSTSGMIVYTDTPDAEAGLNNTGTGDDSTNSDNVHDLPTGGTDDEDTDDSDSDSESGSTGDDTSDDGGDDSAGSDSGDSDSGSSGGDLSSSDSDDGSSGGGTYDEDPAT